MITGAKIKTDRRDAFKLAKYLRLDEFPEAYISILKKKDRYAIFSVAASV